MTEELNLKSMENEKKPNNGKKGVALLVVGIIVLVAIIVFLVMTIFVSPARGDNWYAVFLSNGQTYFGQISKQNSDLIVLKKVHYLQMQQVPPLEEGQEPESQLSLMSVKDELHSPEDEIQINRDHVLYTQKLREDSQVITGIKERSGQ
jgi:hypothetical protein